ncbi:uncharacterized protein BDR25DRAFT_348636 [Lindgomyces ingoldianus]|uniref:Uncharacterized protein n=1 Tax=Lindgomyces ingoldianus TaxID=673940 RepID=A0ACB6RIN8_9PLEO|nr:uncharacterized protein BDR25DRAFT_348636 [Lindgomyces ingoldianus]KAF2478377.1 hypothetical protein BDR25DRAFT_348636 [Lindgomyces ingoldianus]
MRSGWGANKDCGLMEGERTRAPGVSDKAMTAEKAGIIYRQDRCSAGTRQEMLTGLRGLDSAHWKTSKKESKVSGHRVTVVNLNFSLTSDAVISVDGVYGYVGEHVLSLILIKKAKELLDKEYFSVQRQYGLVRDAGFFMHGALDGGETVCKVNYPDNQEGQYWRMLIQRLSRNYITRKIPPPMQKAAYPRSRDVGPVKLSSLQSEVREPNMGLDINKIEEAWLK